MTAVRIVRLGLVLLPVLVNVPYSFNSFAQDDGHPDGDVRRRTEAEDAKAREHQDEEAIARSREPWRGEDLTNRAKPEFLDGNALEAKIEAQQQADQWKVKQAQHAWDGHQGDFHKMGITSENDLQSYLENVRTNPDPDLTTPLPRDRHLYAKVTDGKEGVIVIDNPKDIKNGGTAFWVPDVKQKFQQLENSP
jgi:hypothetical protein